MKYLVPTIRPERLRMPPGYQYRESDYAWTPPPRGWWQLDVMLSPESLAALFIARTNAENSDRARRAARTRKERKAHGSGRVSVAVA